MGEIEAAIGIEQLKKLPKIINKIQMLAKTLSDGIAHLSGLNVPFVDPNCTHVYYAFPLIVDLDKIKCNRKTLVNHLRKEDVPIGEGYQNIHLLPFFQNKKNWE